MSFLPVRRIVPSLRKWSRYRLPPSASLGHDEFLKNFRLPINFTAVQVGDFIDQNLNQGLIEYQGAENLRDFRLFSFSIIETILPRNVLKSSSSLTSLANFELSCLYPRTVSKNQFIFRKKRALKKSGISFFLRK